MNMYTMSMSGRGCVAYGGEEKDGTEEWERLGGLGGEGKDVTEKKSGRTGREDGNQR